MRIIISALVYCGIATLLAESALVGVLCSKGLITQSKLESMLAVVYDVDLPALRAEIQPIDEDRQHPEQHSLLQVQTARKLLHLDLDLLELGADKGWNEMRELRQRLISDRDSYQRLKAAFDESLSRLQKVGSDVALRDVQVRLESMTPKQAKDQIVRILEDEGIGEEQAMDQVMSMIRTMPPDRKKKILSEFKTDEETGRLHELLKHIRQGSTDLNLIRETREKVKKY